MSAEWETVTNLDTLRDGEALRVLGLSGRCVRGDIAGISVATQEYAGVSRLGGLIPPAIGALLVARGQVERRVEPEPHPGDVSAVLAWADEHHWFGLALREAREIVRTINRTRYERGES